MGPPRKRAPIAGFLVLAGIGFAAGALLSFVRALLTGSRLADYADRLGLALMGFILALALLLFAGVLWLAFAGGAAARRRQAAPDQPWTWREDWAAGRAEPLGPQSSVLPWAAAVLWIAFALAPIPALLGHPAARGARAAWAAWTAFPVVAVLLVRWAVLRTWRRRRFGRSLVELHAVPAPLGGRLRGAVVVRLPPRPRSVRLSLSCLDRPLERPGRRSTAEGILWQAYREVGADDLAPGPRGTTSIPVDFELPRDELPTGSDRVSVVRWLLRVQVDIPGEGLDEAYEVPVFEPAASPDHERRARAQPGAARPLARPPQLTVRIERTPAGGVAFAVGATRLVVADGRLTAERRGLLARGSRSWTAAALLSVTTQPRWARGPRGTPTYDLVALGEVLDDEVIASGLRDEREAAWVAQELRRELGLPVVDEEDDDDEDER